MLLLSYLIKFSIALAVIYGFYAVVLRRLTFYRWNRLFLLLYSCACFIIPLINLDPWLKENSDLTPGVLGEIPPLTKYITASAGNYNTQLIFFTFIATGSFVYLTKLILQYLSFRKIKRHAVLLHSAGHIRIYSSAAGGSFTLGNNIYIDTSGQTSDEMENVLQHELIHVKQRHWIDLILGEILCVFNWFNPFAWQMRAAIRQNLEYIADQQVLQKGYDSKAYQYLLLKASNLREFYIAAHFSLTDLKKRINMMNKIKSARVHLVKFVFILPLVIVLLLAFRTVNQSPFDPFLIKGDTIPANAGDDNLIGVTSDSMSIITIQADTVIINKKFDKNVIYTGGEEIVVIQNLKTKEIITMTMKEWNRNKSANEKKYGKLPKPPPPPVPPVPPIPPVPSVPSVPPVPTAATEQVEPIAPPAEPEPNISATVPVPPVPPKAPAPPVKKKSK